MRLTQAEKREFEAAARRQRISLAEFMRRAARQALLLQPAEPASLEASLQGFTLPELPGATERERIRAAMTRRYVAR